MLSLMRRHAKSWLIKLALGAITVVFIFWGVGSYSASRGARVALVNGRTISVNDYNQAYRDLMEMMRQRFGGQLNDELVKEMGLRREALNVLIAKTLREEAAEAAGVHIANDTLAKVIESQPLFQAEGRFSPERYRRFLSANRMDAAAYEEKVRQDLLIRRMEARLGLLALVSAEEARYLYHWLSDQVKIAYVAFDPASFQAKIAPTEADLTAFFQAEKEKYRVPEKVKVQYLAFKPEQFADQVKVDPKEVKEVYDILQESFTEPEQVKLRHILIPVGPQDDKEAKAKAQAQAQAAMKEIIAGLDFAAAAKKYSKDSTAASGGDAGWLSKDQFLPELAETVFKLNKGDLGGPFTSQVGLHIVKIEDKKPASVKPFEQVRPEIEKRLKLEAAKDKALQAAEATYGLSAGVGDLEKLSAQTKQKVLAPAPFGRQDKIEGIPADPKFPAAAFSQNPGEVGPVLELGDGYYLILVKEKIPSRLPEFKEVEARVKGDYLASQTRKLAREAAEKFLKEAQAGDAAKLAAAAGLKVERPEPFSRSQAIKDLGLSLELNRTAFELGEKKPWSEKTFEVGGKFVAFRFEGRAPASEQEFEKEKNNLVARLAAERQREMDRAWLDAIWRKAEIETDKSLL